MKTEVQIGVVGWGGRGRGVAQTARTKTAGMLKTVACMEPYDDKYEMGCQLSGMTPTRYTSVKEMIDKEALDGIIIGSPNEFHLENLAECEGCKIPILIEKPLDSTFEKICNVVRFADKYQGPIIVGHCMRYAPILRHAKKMLKQGDIGKICSVRFVQNCHYGNGGYHNWRRYKESSGTWLLEKATHDFDIMLWLIEDLPVRVAAIQKLQGFGGDKPKGLRCRDCDERVNCPQSIQNIHYRWSNVPVEELKTPDDQCVFGKDVDSPDNDHCLIDFKSGIFGTYVQWFFSPRSYHHRTYELHGTEGAMEIDLGAEFGGKITVCPRNGTVEDKQETEFDYLLRNHYNGDGEMTKHFYNVMVGREEPHSTVRQAFAAELLGYAAIESSENEKFINPQELLPEDLQNLYTEEIY